MTEQKNRDNEPLLSPLMRWFLLAMILANIAGSMSRMLMPIYLTELGASVGQVGLVFTLTSVVILALQMLGGWISDNIGRLRAIAIGSVGGVIRLHPHAARAELAVDAGGAHGQPDPLRPGRVRALAPSSPRTQAKPIAAGSTGSPIRFTRSTGIVGPPLGGLLAGAYGFKPMMFVATIFYSLAAGSPAHLDGAYHALRRRAESRGSFRVASFKNSMLLIGPC